MYNNIMGYSWLCRDSVGSIIEVMYDSGTQLQCERPDLAQSIVQLYMCRVKNNNYLYKEKL